MPTLTAAQRLVEAEDALHALVTGTSARVVVDQNGERIEYTAANRGALKLYIEELKQEIAGENAASNGPLRVVF